MYSPKIEPDKVERLYRLKQELIASGQKTNMVKLVDEALAIYLSIKEKEVNEHAISRTGVKQDERINVG